jgi:hypothetical protein
MKVRFLLLLILLLAIAVQSCGGGGEDIDYVSIAKSFEDAINARDAEAAASLWAEDSVFSMPQDPWDVTTPQIQCMGEEELRECFQTLIDRGIMFRFSDYNMKGQFLCFKCGDSIDGVDWRSSQCHLRFEGEKITFFASYCP